MTAAAAEHQAQRAVRMTEHAKAEEAERQREEAARAKIASAARGRGTGADEPEFLRSQREKLLNKGLDEHLHGSRGSLQRERD